MKLLFQQRFFSWFDSYDIFDEAGNTVYVVKGEPALGHLLRIYDACGNPLGAIREKLFSWMPRFEMYLGERCIGCIRREFSLFLPRYHIDCNGWQVEGNLFGWDYQVLSAGGGHVATVTKELWNWTDTYTIDVRSPGDALCALMLVLAIDAEKCSKK